MDSDAKPGRKGRPPLGPGELDAMALRYVERYATSEEKLARYLRRKLRERGCDREDAPPVAALVQRLAGLRYVYDRQFAEARTRSRARRGYGRRRIGQALARSEEHTSELQSLRRSSYAVFCLKKTKT